MFNRFKNKQIAPGIVAIRSPMVNFFIIQDGQFNMMIDTGFSPKKALHALRTLGLTPHHIQHVFLTHSDMDHVGSLPLYTDATIHLSEDEACMVTNVQPRLFGKCNTPLPHAGVYHSDGEVISIGSLTVTCIKTPGHTPGSMSYVVTNTANLQQPVAMFVGDTLMLSRGRVRQFLKFINMDTDTQASSIKKLAGYTNVQLLCTAHFGISYNAQSAFKGWKPE